VILKEKMIKTAYKSKKSRVVVVGANSGIGQALIAQLIESGTTVFGIDIQKAPQAKCLSTENYFEVNPMDLEAITRVAEKVREQTQTISGLVNLSGTITQFKPILEMDISDWNETYNISFQSCFNSCKVFGPMLADVNGASIVNMSSGLAFIGQKNYGPYSAGKASIISYSKTLAVELGPRIRVNTVAPGAVDTNFIYKEDGSTRFNKEMYTKMVPLGAIAKPDEISSVILFLLSNGASHITGQCLHVNGGAGMH
jgi:3-oxoacyl-[acyl-carrier protein] reductase